MGILSDRQIRAEVKITPFKDYGPKVPGTISSGLGSYGYDSRLGYKFGVFSPIHATVIDPKNFDPKCLVEVDLTPGEYVVDKKTHTAFPVPDHLLIPPHSFVLAETLETYEIPRDVLVICLGKSTYARCGLIVNVTPLEPEWRGVVTLEISNTTPLPVKIYPGEGICQFLFLRTDEKRATLEEDYLKCHGKFDREVLAGLLGKASCERSYADKVGKYQDQKGLTLPMAEAGGTPADKSH